MEEHQHHTGADDDPEYGEIPDHDDDGAYALGCEVVPENVKPVKREGGLEEKKSEKKSEKPSVKALFERAAPRTDMERFQDGCRKASIEPGKPLYMVLATAYRSTLDLKDTLQAFGKGAARGLTPDGEAELIQRVTRQVDLSMRESASKHRLRVGLWTSMAVGVGAVAFLTAGAAGGYWWGWTDGRDSVHSVARDVAVAFQHGPGNAEAVARLLRHNDVSAMLKECRPFEAEGRSACTGTFWLGPAPAAPAPGVAN